MLPGPRPPLARRPRTPAPDPLDVIPLAKPVIGEAEEQAVLEVLRSGHLSLGPRVPAFEAAFAERVGAPHACAVSSGTTGLHLALRAVGVERGDEVVTSPFSFVATANAVALRGRDAGVRRHRPGHAQPRPGGRGGRDQPRARARCCRSTSSATRPTCPRSSATACRSSRTPPRRSAASTPTAAGRRARASGDLRLLREQADDDGRGRDDHARLGGAEGADRLRAQPGPRARHGLARPRPARLQLPALRHRLRARPRPARAARRHARRARPGGRLVPRGARRAAAERGLALPCDAGGAVRGWFVFVVQLPEGSTATRPCVALREHGVQSKPYLPAIHLMSFYRERFGHRPGEFPVCERRRGRVAGAAVLPADDRGPGRARRRGAQRRARGLT